MEPVLLAMCYCISSIPHEVLTVEKKRRQNQDLLEDSCERANAQGWHKSTIILLQINIKVLSGDFNKAFFGEIQIIFSTIPSWSSICQVTWIGLWDVHAVECQ